MSLMSRSADVVVVGVDGCRNGWIAVELRPDHDLAVHFLSDIAEVAVLVPDVAGIGIDIPIRLTDAGPRRADVEARAFLGVKRSSLFPTPIHTAYEAATYAEANALSRRITGSGISRQAYMLRDKVLEVRRWIADAPCPLWEVHPECSFGVMTGAPIAPSKKSWAGMWHRLSALRDAGLAIPGDAGLAGRRGAVDDVIDAAAVAWSTRRIVAGVARSFPALAELETDTTGQPIAIWA
jgi:predicted RNase H-like nuclease